MPAWYMYQCLKIIITIIIIKTEYQEYETGFPKTSHDDCMKKLTFY